MARRVLEFQVVMHYSDEAPETPGRRPFGYERIDHVPTVGESVDLHWLDGRLAGHVVVQKVDGAVLHVGDLLKGSGRGAGDRGGGE